jgi:hypothetical protein
MRFATAAFSAGSYARSYAVSMRLVLNANSKVTMNVTSGGKTNGFCATSKWLLLSPEMPIHRA